MHGNNVLLQVHRTHRYRQIEVSGMETPHMNKYREKYLAENKSPNITNLDDV